MYPTFQVIWRGFRASLGSTQARNIVRIHRANEKSVVILLPHAQQDLLVMIWYVHLLGTALKRAMASLAVPRLFIHNFRITS